MVSTAADPGSQRCTDDFMGASSHNANLTWSIRQADIGKRKHAKAAGHKKIAANYGTYWNLIITG
jgi:hypothetical protein